MNNETTRRPLIAAGTALGIGMGGFVDGIVLHQLLQVHNMLSAKYPTRGIPPEQLVVNLQINMFWDGLFHVLTWVMTAVGLALLWHAVRQRHVPLSTKALVGAMILRSTANETSGAPKPAAELAIYADDRRLIPMLIVSTAAYLRGAGCTTKHPQNATGP